MFKALPWTAGTALIRLHALSSSTGWLVHAGLLPKASLADHPPPRCDDDCYDSTDKGQSKMSQAMVDRWRVHRIWRNGRARENELEVVTSYHISKKDNMTFAKKNTGGDFSSDVFVFSTKSVVYSSWSLLGSVNTRSLNERHWVRAHSVTHRLTEIPHNPESLGWKTHGESQKMEESVGNKLVWSLKSNKKA